MMLGEVPHPGRVLTLLFKQHQLSIEDLLKAGAFNKTVLSRVFRSEMAISADIAHSIEKHFPQLAISAQKLLYMQADYALQQVRAEATSVRRKRENNERAAS